jgi:hypothetical protein
MRARANQRRRRQALKRTRAAERAEPAPSVDATKTRTARSGEERAARTSLRVDQVEPGPPAEPLTLALALTVTLMLADAVTAAPACAEQLTASAPKDAPVEASSFNAAAASGPCVCTARRMLGKFVCTVVTSAVTCAETLPVHPRVTVGGEHCADALA